MTPTATGAAAVLCCATIAAAQTAAPHDLELLNATRRGQCSGSASVTS